MSAIPPFLYVNAKDRNVRAAIKQAKDSIHEFLEAYKGKMRAQQGFSVKIGVKTGRGHEHLWCILTEVKPRELVVSLDNVPRDWKGAKIGNVLKVELNDVEDWMYIDNGWLVGGGTVRCLRKLMTARQALEFDRSVPFIIPSNEDSKLPERALFNAIGNGQVGVVERLIHTVEAGANSECNIASVGPLGYMEIEVESCLCYAVRFGDLDIVNFLVAHGALLEARNRYGATAMMEAAKWGWADLIDAFATFGANINATNDLGISALHTAVANREYSAVAVLLKNGADVNAVDKNWAGALHKVTQLQIAQLLMVNGAKLDQVNKRGRTPLHSAVINGFADIALEMIKHGADLQRVDVDGKTAADYGRKEFGRHVWDGMERVVNKARRRQGLS